WGLSDKPELTEVDAAGLSIDTAKVGERAVVFDALSQETPIFDRERMPPGNTVTGPVIIEEAGSSTVVPPGWSVERDRIGCLVLRRHSGSVQ
ncbi:MAG: hydantoinase/oxoprolinase family protein, partial [Solimonas sp.]